MRHVRRGGGHWHRHWVTAWRAASVRRVFGNNNNDDDDRTSRRVHFGSSRFRSSPVGGVVGKENVFTRHKCKKTRRCVGKIKTVVAAAIITLATAFYRAPRNRVCTLTGGLFGVELFRIDVHYRARWRLDDGGDRWLRIGDRRKNMKNTMTSVVSSLSDHEDGGKRRRRRHAGSNTETRRDARLRPWSRRESWCVRASGDDDDGGETVNK